MMRGRNSVSSSWHAASDFESPGPPLSPGEYLHLESGDGRGERVRQPCADVVRRPHRHSRATFEKATLVSPISAIETAAREFATAMVAPMLRPRAEVRIERLICVVESTGELCREKNSVLVHGLEERKKTETPRGGSRLKKLDLPIQQFTRQPAKITFLGNDFSLVRSVDAASSHLSVASCRRPSRQGSCGRTLWPWSFWLL